MASQSPHTSLASLPVELLRMVLAEMNCLEDLNAATKASDLLEEAFAIDRESILITVIRSSMDRVDPDIFKWMLGVIRIPVYEDLAYVANSPPLEWAEELGTGKPWPWNDWHVISREHEIRRLAKDFSQNEMPRIESELSDESIASFSVPCLSRAKNAMQRAEHKRIVNEVARLYDELRDPTRFCEFRFPSLDAIREVFGDRKIELYRSFDVWLPFQCRR